MGILLIIIGIICFIAGISIIISDKKAKTEKDCISYSTTNQNSESEVSQKTKNEADNKFKKIQDFDENEQKGFKFEQFIENLVLREKLFVLEDHRRDVKTVDGKLPISSRYPDYDFLLKLKGGNNVRFSVECKYRSRFFNDTIHWAEPYQIKTYTQYEAEKNTSVFVALGVGGKPEEPKEVYMIPISDAQSPDLNRNDLQQYRLKIKEDTKLFFDTKEKRFIVNKQ